MAVKSIDCIGLSVGEGRPAVLGGGDEVVKLLRLGMSGNLEGQLAGGAVELDVGCVCVCVWSGERWKSTEIIQDFSSGQLEWQCCLLLRREGLGVAAMNLIVEC